MSLISSLSSTITASSFVFLVRLGGTASGLFVTLILSRSLGPSDFGIYSYVLAVLMLCTVPVSYGFATILLSSSSVSSRTGDWSIPAGQQLIGSLLAAGAAILFAITHFVFAENTNLNFGVISSPVFGGSIALVLFFDQLSALRSATLRGLNHPVLANVPEAIVRPLVFAFVFIVSAHFFSDEHLLLVAATTLVVGASTNAFVGSLILKKKSPVARVGASAQYRLLEWISDSYPIAFSSFLSILIAYADFFILGYFGNAADLGNYRVAMQIALVAGLGYAALNFVVMQKFAHYLAGKELASLQKEAGLVARIGVASGLPIVITLFIGGDWIVPTVFGSQFHDAVFPSIILSSAQVLNSVFGMPRALLLMAGHSHVIMKLSIVSLALCICVCFALTHYWGLNGAAIASLVGVLMMNVFFWVYARKLTGVDTSVFSSVTR